MSPESRGALAVCAVLFSMVWGASALADHFVRPDSDLQTPTGADHKGKVIAPVGASPTAVPASTLVRRQQPVASRSRRPALPRETGTRLDVTCYSYTGSRTASGLWPRVGMAASNTYDFGTRLHVEHVGVVTVQDRIGHGTDLDLYGPSEAFCRQFGRQHLLVRVIS